MIQKLLDALIDIVLWIPRQLFGLLVDAVELMLGWLPEIDIVDIQGIFDGIGGEQIGRAHV